MNGHLINITDLSAFIDIFATEHLALEDQNAINFAASKALCSVANISMDADRSVMFTACPGSVISYER
jgi:hypothetical protein